MRRSQKTSALRDISNALNGGFSSDSGGGKKRGGGGYRTYNNTSKYCWTHGDCAHESKFYKNKAIGHLYNTAFNVKMSGSLDFAIQISDTGSCDHGASNQSLH